MALEAQVFMMFATGGKHLWPISYGPYGQQHKYLGEKIAEKSSRKKLRTVGASLCGSGLSRIRFFSRYRA